MFAENIHVSAAPDFVIKIGQVIHNHTVTISVMGGISQYKDELFSHRSQIEVVRYLRQRFIAEGCGDSLILEWFQHDNLSAKIINSNLAIKLEYRLPSQLSFDFKNVIYAEFKALMNKFVKIR